MAKKPWPLVLLDLPAYAIGVFILYWSVPLSVALGYIKFWKLDGKRDDAYGWGKGLQKLFGIKVLRLKGPDLCKAGKIIYLANHRSWADFFLDVVMTEGRAQMLSRMAVLTVFPAFMIPVSVIKSVILFQRGKKVDFKSFNQRISKAIEESPVEGLIVYPEGHRSTRTESLALKRGMLHYCYDHKVIVQIVITKNKEAVLSEKQLSCHFGQTVLCGYAEAIDPGQFETFEAFSEEIQKTWDAEWKRVYSAQFSDGYRLNTASYETHEYPEGMKRLQLWACGLSCLAFLVTLIISWRTFFWIASLLGTLKTPFLSVLAVWLGVSIARALSPMDTTGAKSRRN